MPGATCARCGYLMRDLVDGTRCPVCARNRRNSEPHDKPINRARNPRYSSAHVPKPNDEARRRSLGKILDEVTEILRSKEEDEVTEILRSKEEDEVTEILRSKEESAGFTPSHNKVDFTQIGGTSEFTVVLDAKPYWQVHLYVASTDDAKVRISPIELTFTNDNWYEPQTVTVIDMSDAEDHHAKDYADADIILSVNPRKSDEAFHSVPSKTVSTITSLSKEAKRPDSETNASEVMRSDVVVDSAPSKTESTTTSRSKEEERPHSEALTSEVLTDHFAKPTGTIRKLSLMVMSLATGAAVSIFIVYDLLPHSAQTWIHGIY